MTKEPALIVLFGWVKDNSEANALATELTYGLRRAPRRGGRLDGEPFLAPQLFVPYLLATESGIEPYGAVYVVTGPATAVSDGLGSDMDHWSIPLGEADYRYEELEWLSDPRFGVAPPRGTPLVGIARCKDPVP